MCPVHGLVRRSGTDLTGCQTFRLCMCMCFSLMVCSTFMCDHEFSIRSMRWYVLRAFSDERFEELLVMCVFVVLDIIEGTEGNRARSANADTYTRAYRVPN